MKDFALIYILSFCTLVSTYAWGQADSDSASVYRSMLDKYCISCHNDALKTAGVILDKANIADLGQDPGLWERVMTKLSLRAMPPVGMPLRPDESEYESIVDYLMIELDRAAIEKPNPGNVTVHRLNRAEYSNAIRDILDMDIDVTAFLPADNVREGFDNIADSLALSPLLMEQYLFAAGRISQLALGPEQMLPAGETYYLSADYQQNMRMSEDLPFATRGGIAVKHRFPLDGEYTVSIQLNRDEKGYVRGLRNEHNLDVLINHNRVGTVSVGGKFAGRSGMLFTGRQNPYFAGDPEQAAYELFGVDDGLQVRFSAKAGTNLVAVTFHENNARSTGILQPRLLLDDLTEYKGGDPTISNITITGPYNAKGKGETASRNKIFTCYPKTNAEHYSCAENILTALARKAYRRSVTSRETGYLLDLYEAGYAEGGFEAGIELALQGILAGPEFIFRVDLTPANVASGSVYPVSDLELASRLSFFLWSSVPDDELLTLAESGQLRQAGVLEQQVRRMLTDPRSSALIDNFAAQWLSVRNIDIVEPQINLFPEYDAELKDALDAEMRLWFASMLREDRSVLDLLTSNHTYVNERLARHYGIDGIYGSRFQRIELNNLEQRRGLLGKGGLLMATSFNNRTSPVIRGKWVLENLLNMPPPPPPDDVPALEVQGDDGKELTLKQAMEQHRANPVCSSCHKLMDPIGLALENFDAIGAYRDTYMNANQEVDSSGILFDGSPFQNLFEFQMEFQKYSERVAHTVAEKMLMYALGRTLEYYDQPVVREIVKVTADANHTWSSMILAVVNSMPFQYRSASNL